MTVDAAEATAFALGGSGGLRRRERGAAGTWAGIALIGFFVALPLRGLYRFTGGTMEEGFMLYFPELVRRGKVPNVDFLHLYGPGSLDALLVWYEVFGNTLAAERTFGLLQHLGIIFGLFTLARVWGRAAATAVGVLAVFYVMTPIGLTAMAWNGGIALTLWTAVFVVRAIHADDASRRARNAAVAGLLGGLALTFRPDLVIVLAGLGIWLFVNRRRAGEPDAAWKWPLAGAAVGLLPMWIHLAQAGIGASWRGMVTDPVFELRPGRELPVPPSWSRLDGALQAVAETVPPWYPFPHLSASHSIFLWFWAMLVISIGFLVFALWLRRRGRRDGASTVLVAVGIVSVAILSQGLQRPDSAHLLWVTCIPWPFLVAAVAEVVRTWRPSVDRRQALTIGGAAALVITFVLTGLFTFRYYALHTRVGLGQVPSAFEVGRDGRNFRFGDYRASVAVQGVVDDLDRLAEPGERLLVGPADLRRTWYSDAVIYWYFPELEPATYYIEMDPGLANAEGSSLADDVASADWVILTNLWAGWMEPNTSADYGSDAPNQVIREQFCVVSSYENGLATLYARCAEPAP